MLEFSAQLLLILLRRTKLHSFSLTRLSLRSQRRYEHASILTTTEWASQDAFLRPRPDGKALTSARSPAPLTRGN